jgi:hypothetical protein
MQLLTKRLQDRNTILNGSTLQICTDWHNSCCTSLTSQKRRRHITTYFLEDALLERAHM